MCTRIDILIKTIPPCRSPCYAGPMSKSMSRSRMHLFLLLFALAPHIGTSRGRPVVVSAGPKGTAQITRADGSMTTVPKERGQVGISDPQTSPDDRTVGWLVDRSEERRVGKECRSRWS